MSGFYGVVQETKVKLRKVSTPVQPMLALGRFGRYKIDGGRSRVGKPIVKKDEVLQKLHKAFVEFLTYTWAQALEDSEKSGSNSVDEENYRKGLSLIKDLQYSCEDVERFSLEIGKHQDHMEFAGYAGLFLSVLINNGNEDEYTIHTAQLSKPIELLGYRNIKNITVKGTVGNGLGYHMKCGIITIEGNAGCQIGGFMENGAIHLNGEYIRLGGFSRSGRIYHKGKLIFGIEK